MSSCAGGQFRFRIFGLPSSGVHTACPSPCPARRSPRRRASGTGPVPEGLLGDGAPTLGKNYTGAGWRKLAAVMASSQFSVPFRAPERVFFPCVLSLGGPQPGPEGQSTEGVSSVVLIANSLKNQGSSSLRLTTRWVWHEGCNLRGQGSIGTSCLRFLSCRPEAGSRAENSPDFEWICLPPELRRGSRWRK